MHEREAADDARGGGEPGESTDAPDLTPVEPASSDTPAIREPPARVTEVPWIGTAWRWYDIPYRVCDWLLSSWPRRLMTWRLRRLVNRWLNFFIPFNEYDRQRAEPLDDRMHNLILPQSETIRQGGRWVLELFPPSHYDRLVASLRKNGWDREELFGLDGTNAEMVQAARSGDGFRWWRLGAVADPRAGYIGMGMTRESLPAEFSLVELTATQVGKSLTAVTASFRLNDLGRDRLNGVWRATHEPTLTLRGLRRAHVQGRYFAAIGACQTERQRLHDTARDWLAQRCPGFFASSPGRHPVMDLTLFSEFDPALDPPTREMREGLRALGMDADHVHIYISPQLPGLTLIPTRTQPRHYEVVHNCWGSLASTTELSK